MDESRRRAEARIGKVLRDRYRIDALLGIGGMAVVYLATHRNQKKFAIKMLHPELAMNAEAKQRFVREGYVANTIDHPSAVAVMDDDVSDDGAPFLVMELLDGVEVGELAEQRGGTLAPTIVLAIADQVLAVLEAAHKKNIVHRDLKPANLFLTRDGTVKVLDFGIARMRDAMTNTLNGLTAAGSILGTPAFLPPEQAGGRTREIDARTDLWALGATMYKLLSGRYVHDAATATQIVILAATQPAPSIAWAIGSTAPAVVPVVDRALAFERDARWPSAEAMRAAVREAHRTLSGGALPTRESLAEVFGIGTWETKFAEVLKPPPGAPSGSLPLPGVVQARGRATAPMPAGQHAFQPTAPMPVAPVPQAATAQPVESSIGVSVPMNKSHAPLLLVIALALTLAIGVAVAVAVVLKAKSSEPATPASTDVSEIVRVAPSAPASSFAIAPPSASISASAATPATASTSVSKPVINPAASSAKPPPCVRAFIGPDGEKHFTPCP
jgi:serine/threonine-protein kinase